MNQSIVDLRKNLSDVLNRVAYGGERVILQRRGKGVAALVSMEDLQLLQELEDKADIRAARKALKEKGGVPLEKIKARLLQELEDKADVRAARKAMKEKGGITLEEFRKKHGI